MSGSAEQERLQAEIEELRGELGETVEALAHKADIPARVKERGHEVKEQAVERGSELWDQAVDAAGQARQAATRTTEQRWPVLAGVGLTLLALLVVMRRMRAR